MSYTSFEAEREAKDILEKAFNDIKWRHSGSWGRSRTELSFRGVNSPTRQLDYFKSEIDDLIHYIEREEQSCDRDLQYYCSDFYEAIKYSRVATWVSEKESDQIAQKKLPQSE